MIRRIVTYFKTIPPIFIDGSIYVMLAVTSANALMMSSDNAFKYISAEVLFYMTWGNAIVDGALLALKLFRSTAFADHKQQVKDETAFITRSQTQSKQP